MAKTVKNNNRGKQRRRTKTVKIKQVGGLDFSEFKDSVIKNLQNIINFSEYIADPRKSSEIEVFNTAKKKAVSNIKSIFKLFSDKEASVAQIKIKQKYSELFDDVDINVGKYINTELLNEKISEINGQQRPPQLHTQNRQFRHSPDCP